MGKRNDTPAESTTKSLVSLGGKPLQRSERDAALLSEIQNDPQLSGNSEAILVLLSLLHGITENTTSGDVIELAVYRAQSICAAAGVSEKFFREVVAKFVTYSKKARAWNPLSF